jgi:hypothetical protein
MMPPRRVSIERTQDRERRLPTAALRPVGATVAISPLLVCRSERKFANEADYLILGKLLKGIEESQ